MGKSYTDKVKSRSNRERNINKNRRTYKNDQDKPPFPFLPVALIAVITILIVSGVVAYTSQPDGNGSNDDVNDTPNNNGNNGPQTGNTGPGEILLESTSGTDIFLDQYKGKVIVLDMFATWCAPCKTQMVELEKLETRFSPSEIVILSVGADLSESIQLISEFQVEEGANWPFARSTTSFNSAFPASSIPTIYILDKDGDISQTRVGVTGADILESDIRALL
jgi:thiol-disulfide isomerase/thioredoxin